MTQGGSDGSVQDQHQGDRQRLLRRRDDAEVRAVARQLDEVQRNTARFLAFTLSSDRMAKTALFAMCVEEDDPVKAVAAAYSWVVTAINVTGDGAYEWEMAARPEERERILA